MRFIRLKCKGSFNSFRQPDFHTYHKTLPLPPKTTVAGLIGSALGISPADVNENWLLNDRFKMGIIGTNNGQANDLWQIRKYESKQIKAFEKGEESTPYKTAVIVRELLFQCQIALYLTFDKEEDFNLVKDALLSPQWALSLGREDELIQIESIDDIEIFLANRQHRYKETVIAGDLSEIDYKPELNADITGNLLKVAPKTVSLPVSFVMNRDSEIRQGNDYRKFTYVGNLPILIEGAAYWDEAFKHSFQIF